MADHPLIRYPPSNNSLLSNTTKKAIAYEPRTEAISPAINDDMLGVENSVSKSTKDEQTLLVDKLKKVEAEIVQTDLQINRLRKQKQQLEQAASSAGRDDDDQENVCDTKQLSIAKLVYHENRAKAQKAHAKLDCFNATNRDLPLYNQPSDNAIYHFTAAKFSKVFKNRLIACFRERLQARLKLEETVSAEYDRRMEKWLKKIEHEDSQPHKRVLDARVRDFFEKQFPELKRARESGERFSRVGQRVARSDAEFDELLDGIAEREDRDKKVKSYAVIPPMLEEMRSKKPKYLNRNGYVEDIIAEYKEYQILNTWTDEEKEMFRENYLQHPKNFAFIASVTSRKNTANCVQYYYLSKKGENYKQWVKRQQKRKTRSFGKPAQQALPPATSNNNDSSETNNRTTNGLQDKTTNESQDAQNQDPMEHSDLASKTDALHNSVQKQSSDRTSSDANQNILDSTTCFLCGCEFNESNQFRNVTRSNHQLYGIGMDLLRPGMRICYPCRFRHIRHPNFNEPLSSPEPFEEDDEQLEEELEVERPSSPMEIELPKDVLKSDSGLNDNCTKQLEANQSINGQDKQPDHALADASKSVRDMIYRAIEIELQKPKPPEFLAEANVKSEPIRPEVIQLNPMTPQLNIPNALPLKPVSVNHAIPPHNPLPPHLPIQNLTVDPHHQLQVQMQQKQQQLQIEYNIRHQQYLSQQLQQQHQQQQQQQQQQLQQQQLQQQQQQQQLQQQQQQMQIEFNLRQHQYLAQQMQQTHQLQQQQHHHQQQQQHHLQQQHQQQQHLIQQQQQLQHLPRLQQQQQQQPPPPPPPQLHHVVRLQQPPPPPTSPATKQFIRPIPSARMPSTPAVNSAHPIDFSRKYVEPPPPPTFPEPKNHVTSRPPPMAHGARASKTVPSHTTFDQGVLNLSKPSPTTIAAPVASMMPMLSMTPLTSITSMPPLATVTSMPPLAPAPSQTPIAPLPSLPLPTLPPPPQPQASASERHPPSHSPNLTGSPSSPSEMVIDETASPGSSREDD